MKPGSILAAACCCVLAACSSFRPLVFPWSYTARLEAQLRRQSVSPEELGVQSVGAPGSQTIRWKEAIAPPGPVKLPLLPPAHLSVQPRIHARINDGSPILIALDSGAALNAFDAAFALSNGVKVLDPDKFGNTFQGLGGGEFSYYGMFDRLDAGELSAKNLLTLLRLPAKSNSEPLENFLGLTTLAKFSFVTIDFLDRQATFSLADPYQPARTVVSQAPLLLESLRLIVELQINGRFAIDVLLDTGNDAQLMLTEEMVNQLELSHEAGRGRKVRFLGIGGEVETRTFPIQSMAIGGRVFGGVQATVVPDTFPPALGSGFLQQFRVTLDFKNRKLWLEQ